MTRRKSSTSTKKTDSKNKKKQFTECYQKHDWNKRARGMKTIFGHSARKIILAKGSGQKDEVEWYCGTVNKLLLRLVGKVKAAEEPKAFYILQEGFDQWLKLIDYPVIEPQKKQCAMLVAPECFTGRAKR